MSDQPIPVPPKPTKQTPSGVPPLPVPPHGVRRTLRGDRAPADNLSPTVTGKADGPTPFDKLKKARALMASAAAQLAVVESQLPDLIAGIEDPVAKAVNFDIAEAKAFAAAAKATLDTIRT